MITARMLDEEEAFRIEELLREGEEPLSTHAAIVEAAARRVR